MFRTRMKKQQIDVNRNYDVWFVKAEQPVSVNIIVYKMV